MRGISIFLQNIILYEYLPALLNEDLPSYDGYKPDLHPGISHIFQSAAFRFGHTLIPPGIYRRDEKCEYRRTNTGQPAIRLCSTWWDSNVSHIFTLIDLLHISLKKKLNFCIYVYFMFNSNYIIYFQLNLDFKKLK